MRVLPRPGVYESDLPVVRGSSMKRGFIKGFFRHTTARGKVQGPATIVGACLQGHVGPNESMVVGEYFEDEDTLIIKIRKARHRPDLNSRTVSEIVEDL